MPARALTDEQRRALELVGRLNLERRKLRDTLEDELRREYEERLRKAHLAEAQAVAQAIQVGVPKARIGQDGLHTRDPHAVRLALRVLEP